MADSRTTSLYVIAYDIPSDRRRTRVHKILSGYGTWTQYSVFECFLTEKQYLELRHKLEQYLRVGEDSVRFYVLCSACHGRSSTLEGRLPEEPDALIV